jgi:hypothetical protein
MATRTTSSSSQVLLVILLVVTFPVWFAAGAAVLGVAAGLFGAVIGIFGAIFGVLMTLVALPFKILFEWSGGGWHWFPHLHFNAFVMIAVIIVAALVIKGRK